MTSTMKSTFALACGVTVVVLATTGCSIKTLDSVAAAMALTTQSERAQERAELHALAEKTATAETSPVLETQESYLQVIAQLQGKQLWFASLAHLDVLEQRWPASERSQLLRADALRQVGETQSSRAIYERLQQGSLSAKAQHGLGLLSAQEQRFGDAVRHLVAARAQLPTDALLLSDLGYALLHTAQAQDARIPLMQAAQLQPSNTRIAGNMALYLVLFGAPEAASEWMQQHQLTSAQKVQVFEQAQKLASVHAAASQKAQVAEVHSSITPAVPVETAQRNNTEVQSMTPSNAAAVVAEAAPVPQVPTSLSLPVPALPVLAPVTRMAPAGARLAAPAVHVATAPTPSPSVWMTDPPKPGVRP